MTLPAPSHLCRAAAGRQEHPHTQGQEDTLQLLHTMLYTLLLYKCTPYK